MSGPARKTKSSASAVAQSGRMIRSRKSEKDFASGAARKGKVDLSKGMPRKAAEVRRMLFKGSRPPATRERYLIDVEKDLDKVQNGPENFLYVYHWLHRIPLEVDVRISIDKGRLPQRILTRLPRLLPEAYQRAVAEKKIAESVRSTLAGLKARAQPSQREFFFEWVLDNWNYFRANGYTHKAFKPVDGLFFFEPSPDQDFESYLDELYSTFLYSVQKTNAIIGVKSGVGAAQPEPVDAYVSMSRWIALNAATRVRGKPPSSYFAFLTTLPENLRELKRRLSLKYNYYKRPRDVTVKHPKPRDLVVWPSTEILEKINRKLVRDRIPRL